MCLRACHHMNSCCFDWKTTILTSDATLHLYHMSSPGQPLLPNGLTYGLAAAL